MSNPENTISALFNKLKTHNSAVDTRAMLTKYIDDNRGGRDYLDSLLKIIESRIASTNDEDDLYMYNRIKILIKQKKEVMRGGKSRRKHKKSRKSHHRLKRQRLRTRRRHTHRLRQRNR